MIWLLKYGFCYFLKFLGKALCKGDVFEILLKIDRSTKKTP